MTTIGVAIAVPRTLGRPAQDYRTDLGDDTASGIPTHITLMPPFEVPDGHLPVIEQHLAGPRRRTRLQGAPARHRHLPPGLAGGVRDRGRGHLRLRAARRSVRRGRSPATCSSPTTRTSPSPTTSTTRRWTAPSTTSPTSSAPSTPTGSRSTCTTSRPAGCRPVTTPSPPRPTPEPWFSPRVGRRPPCPR